MAASGTDVVLRQRVERVIAALAPLLDLMLAVGDRVSRVLDPDDPQYQPPHMARHGESAPRGLTTSPLTRRAPAPPSTREEGPR